jgi:uncharacterized protein YecE (DUF72 family)
MQLLIGTSGWLYDDWVGKFYTEDLKDRDKLPFYSKHFRTVEINSTFYRMPPAKTFEHWYEVVPKKFIYAIKFSRYITRTKRLTLDDESKPFIREFLKRSKKLKERLGAVIIQLPPSLRCDNKLLENFLKYLTGYAKRLKYKADFAIEFRHASWFNEETYKVLGEFNTAFVIADSSRYPGARVITADFSYIRLHGPEQLFASEYSKAQLEEWAGYIKANKNVKRFYVYFNNDFYGYAIGNANQLKNYLGRKSFQYHY